MFVIVVSGNFRLKLFVSLWLPESHAEHRSKNDMLIDFIENLKSQFATSVQTLSFVPISFDSAYCVQKVMQAICDTDLKVITKPNKPKNLNLKVNL